MQITYNVRRSSFHQPCAQATEADRAKIASGSYIVIQVNAKADGYPGQFNVTIDPHDWRHVEAEPDISEPTRFGARIKAAATVLRDCGFSGDFDIWHEAGTIRLRKS